ncbi:MAG: EscU/YscU/HrcU family type III secretion system export apparatus switch protein, partial [Armatimonadota bacterium]
MSETAGEKTEEATFKRRREAREKGTVAKSIDLTGALSLLVASALIPGVVQNAGAAIWTSLQKSAMIPTQNLTAASVTSGTFSLGLPVAMALIPLLLTICCVGVASQFAQVGFVLSGQSMTPSLDKINPLQGFKRLFSARAAMEGAKAFAKMLIFGWVAYSAVSGDWVKLTTLSALTPAQSATLVGGLLHSILMRIAMVWLTIAGVDYFFQRKSIDKSLRMTKQE